MIWPLLRLNGRSDLGYAVREARDADSPGPGRWSLLFPGGVFAQLRFQLFRARQGAFVSRGQRLHQLRDVARDSYGLREVPEGVFGHDLVFRLAEHDADEACRRGGGGGRQRPRGRSSSCRRYSGLNAVDLEVDHDVSTGVQVIEEQVDVEVLAADLEVNLLPDEREAGPEFEEELPDVGEESLLERRLSSASSPSVRKSNL